MTPVLIRLAVLLCLSLSGCSFDAKYRSMSLRAPASDVKLEYFCRPGDRISLTFMQGLGDGEVADYRLQPGDEVQLNVQDRDDLNRTTSVAPDGKIYFPYLDPIPASGKTLKEVERLAEDKYQPMVSNARVTVVPIHYAGKMESILQSLAGTSRQGPEYSTSIGLDGKALFPDIGYMKASGLTPRQLNDSLRLAYQNLLPGVEVTANISLGSSRYVTLLGELRKPGSFPVEGSVSLTAALGLAEGWLPSARVEDIVLVQFREAHVLISKVDLAKDLLTATQLQLVGGDLVFIPRSAITDLNIFVDQYLRRNLPFSVGVSVPAQFLEF
jgi:protein involved in polysaccharide export with SLBB domain